MAVLNAMSNGNAPSGASVGDYVNTAAGMYQVVSPGTYGSSYNPSSGLWSIKADTNNDGYNAAYMQNVSNANSLMSQNFAREQMDFQREQNAKAMQFSADQAELNRSWQEKMSNTAHQREVADLIAAGLNPVLSATGGSGASTPSGASASGVTSSGASGSVDTTFGSSLSSYLNSLINKSANMAITAMNVENNLEIAELYNATNRFIAELNASTGIKTAGISAGAAISSAQTSAAANMYSANQYTDTQKYIAANYPNTKYGAISAVSNALKDYITTSGNSGRTTSSLGKKLDNAISSFLKWTPKTRNNSYGRY